ncbi:MAG: PPC domain-containing protein [Deltaproteobacteria bacterium]|nr:PPC domain-containing protein [Deltaproteobacteria bacterium]
MRTLLTALGALVALGMAACPTEVGPQGGECTIEEGCAGGRVCQDGSCVEACSEGGCQDGLCDLDSGRCVECLDASDCPDGFVCNGFTDRCTVEGAGCASDDECAGLRCDTIKGSCVQCLEDGDCGLSALCDLLTGMCTVEQSCVTDGDCSFGVCHPDKRTCVECFNPAHCPSGVCDDFSSTCVAGCDDDDATEPNAGADAVALADGGAHEGAICPGDKDEFLVHASGTLTATLAADSGATLALRIESAAGSSIASGTQVGGNLVARADGLAEADYRVVVQGNGADGAGAYLLTIDVTAAAGCAELDAEPNDSTAQATAVATTGALTAGAICGSNTDHFSFTAAAGDSVEVVAVAGEGEGTPQVAILSSAGAVLGSGNPATLASAPGGALYARVSATGGDVSYSLRVTVSSGPPPCTQSDAEPNDADAQAVSITPGVSHAGTICPGDVDQLRFAAAALDDVSVTVTGTGVTARLVRASDGSTVASGLSISAANVAAGGYRVVVQGSTGTSQGSYTVIVGLTPEPVPDPCEEAGLEPDDGAARPLALDGTQSAGRICASDTDYFSFTLAFATTVTITARFTDATGDLDLRLVDAAGATIDSAASVTDNETIVEALAAGTYGVRIYGWSGATNTYTMEATLQGCTPDDAYEDNNSWTRATPIGTAVVSAARCPGDDDYYAVRLGSGDALDATLTGSGATLSLVSSTTGALLVSDTASGGNRRLQASGLAPGRYALRVTGMGSARVAYTLNAGITSSASCIDDGAAPNDSAATAFALDDTGLLDGSYQVGSLVSCSVGDADWFRIALPGAKQVTVQLAFDPSDDVDIEVLEPRGTGGLTRSLARSYATTVQDRVRGIMNVGGDVFLRAVGYESTQTAYAIGVELASPPASACTDDRFDTWTATSSGTDTTFTNDTASTSVVLSSGELLPQLQICTGNKDFFKIAATTGQTVRVHVAYAHGSNQDIDVRLYGPASQASPLTTCTQYSNTTGTGLTCSSAGVDGTEDLVLPVAAADAGDHYIEVLEYGSDGSNAYELSVTVE